MLGRLAAGTIPAKPHTTLRDENGRLLYEHCLTREGFNGPFTISYHLERPHVAEPFATDLAFALPQSIASTSLKRRHLRSAQLNRPEGPPLQARQPLLFNSDVVISVLFPTVSDPAYFSNGDADDLFFIQAGSGMLRCPLGDLRFQAGDYVIVPRGMLHRFILDAGVAQYWLSVECLGGLDILPEWRNAHGQLRMGAPYCERDFQKPVFHGPRDEQIRQLVVKRQQAFHGFLWPHSPLDVVGYDGAVYPLIFPISKFAPRVGQVHLPPTYHGTFSARGALICSFVPRPLDFHPDAVPCPYPHSSVDVDEVLFYARGNFTSRRGIESGSLSLHPAGLPHGPHPGAYEASLGAPSTDELAVMLDCYQPLSLTPFAAGIDDTDYEASFR